MAAVVCMTATVGCKDDSYTIVCDDLFYFLFVDHSAEGGYMSACTELTVKEDSVTQLFVARQLALANANPKQEVKIVVDGSSTAEQGKDFNLDKKSFSFKNADATQMPVTLSVNGNTRGKRIVLRLEYGYDNIAPHENRKADILTINIE